jgi:Zn-dependent protease with chaperone function
MTGRLRALLLSFILLAFGAAGALIAMQDIPYRVDLESVREIWADLVRDADKVGLTLTRVPTAEEAVIGDRIAAGIPTVTGSPLEAYVNAVGSRVAAQARRRKIPFRFHIVSMPEINAFAIPGGHVYVTTGMLDAIQTEAELASVLAHEISHIDLRHCIEQFQYEIQLHKVVGDLAILFRLPYWLLEVSYSQERESEADRSGMLLMAEAGYSPLEALGIFARLREIRSSRPSPPRKPSEPVSEAVGAMTRLVRDYFKTHPDTPDRIVQFQELLEQNARSWSGRTFCVGRSNYVDRVTCADRPTPSEMISISPGSADTQVRLGGLAFKAGEEREAASLFAAALRLSPDLPDQLVERGRKDTSEGDSAAALANFDAALQLALFDAQRLSRIDAGPAADRRRERLRTAFVEDAGLARSLDRAPSANVPVDLMDYSRLNEADLCRLALNKDGTDWDATEFYEPARSEALSRGLLVRRCRGAIRLPPLPAARAE